MQWLFLFILTFCQNRTPIVETVQLLSPIYLKQMQKSVRKKEKFHNYLFLSSVTSPILTTILQFWRQRRRKLDFRKMCLKIRTYYNIALFSKDFSKTIAQLYFLHLNKTRIMILYSPKKNEEMEIWTKYTHPYTITPRRECQIPVTELSNLTLPTRTVCPTLRR